MEEGKAAAYYDELLRVGGAAARFKQGLGFSSDARPAPGNDARRSMPSFVKAGSGPQGRRSPSRDGVRESDEPRNGPHSMAAEIVALKLGGKRAREGSRRSPAAEHGGRRGSRSGSPLDRCRARQEDRGYAKRCYSPPKGRNRNRGRSVNCSPPALPRRKTEDQRRSTTFTSDSSASPGRKHRKRRRRSFSPASSSPESRRSGGGRRERRRDTLVKECGRSRSYDTSSDEKREYSQHKPRERSYKNPRARSRSRSSSHSHHRPRHRDYKASCKRNRNRSLSVSSDEKWRSSEHKRRGRECRDVYEGSRSRSSSISTDEKQRSSQLKPRQCERSKSRPPYQRSRDEESKVKRHLDSARNQLSSVETGRQNRGREFEGTDKVVRSGLANFSNPDKISSVDYSKLIPGFDSMTFAEKVKAKMKLQLSEAVSKGSMLKSAGGTWERFHFDKEAPLDDDATLELDEDRTEAGDDATFLQNTGSSFFSSTSQARREIQVQAVHESAIFGMPSNDSTCDNKGSSREDYHTAKNVVAGCSIEKNASTALNESLVSEQVFLMQQTSWRERALKSKDQRASNAPNV